MKSLTNSITEYKKQLQKGDLQFAYRSLIKYMMKLRTHFKTQYPDYFVSGSIYQGYMDITFFAFTPAQLKKDKLKIAIILNHEKMKFEIWLVGQNKQIQKKYWELFKGSDWETLLSDGKEYKISTSGKDSILEGILIKNPNFDDLDALTLEIEDGTLAFIKELLKIIL